MKKRRAFIFPFVLALALPGWAQEALPKSCAAENVPAQACIVPVVPGNPPPLPVTMVDLGVAKPALPHVVVKAETQKKG
jgi:hypothetical protein